MTDFIDIAASETDPGAPLRSSLFKRLASNLIGAREGHSAAPVEASQWHPYNKVTNGDANTGKFYDFSVSGAVASIETPNFVDGYEYRIRLDRLSSSSSATLSIELYKETSAAYDAATTIGTIGSPANNVSGEIEVLRPRAGLIGVPVKYLIVRTEASGVFPATTTFDAYLSVQDPAEKRLKARLKWSAGNIDLGTAYLDKRLAIL